MAVLQGLTGQAVELDGESHGWKAIRCPFHDDRAASGSYNTESQRFRCHGCGIAGDGYDVIQEVERCDFATARQWCAQNLGSSAFSPLSQATDAPSQRSKLTDRRTKERAKLIRNKYRR